MRKVDVKVKLKLKDTINHNRRRWCWRNLITGVELVLHKQLCTCLNKHLFLKTLLKHSQILFGFIFLRHCVKQCEEVLDVSSSIRGDIRAGSCHLCTLKKITLMTPNCLPLVIFKWPDVRLGCFLGNKVLSDKGSARSIYRQARKRRTGELSSYHIFASLLGSRVCFSDLPVH